MKLAKIAHLLIIAVAVSISSTGCRKKLDKTTQIPGRGPGSITEQPAPPRSGTDPNARPGLTDGTPIFNPARPATDGTTGTALPPAGSDIPIDENTDTSNWHQDRETFKNQTVYFDFDKSVVKASEIPKLEEVARRMKAEFVGKALRIEGHCDERGTEEYNRALGDRRALSVREQFSGLGVDPKIISTISFGEERPAESGHTDAAWSKNRRGELILLTRP